MATGSEGRVAATDRGWTRRAVRAVFARTRERAAELFLSLFFALFCVLAWGIRTPQLRAYDLNVTRAWQRPQTPVLDSLATLFTHVGDFKTLAAVGMSIALLLFCLRKPHTAVLSLLALAGHPLTFPIKALFDRARPEAEAVRVLLPASGLSFPSGHALGSTLFYGYLAFLVWVLIPRLLPRVALTLSLASLPLAVCVSRVYVGAHWLSDVIGGCTAGLFFLLLLARLYRAGATPEMTPVAASVPPDKMPAAEP